MALFSNALKTSRDGGYRTSLAKLLRTCYWYENR